MASTVQILSIVCLVGIVRAVYGSAVCELVFPESDEECPRALALLEEDIATDAFSFCLHLNLESKPEKATTSVLSYSSYEAGQYNEILLEFICEYEKNYVSLTIGGEGLYLMEFVPETGKWVHLCVTWSSEEGNINLFIDGERKANNTLKKGHTIGKQGSFVLGVDQDGYDGGYYAGDGVVGRIGDFNFWDTDASEMLAKKPDPCLLNGQVMNSGTNWGLFDGIGCETSTSPCAKNNCQDDEPK